MTTPMPGWREQYADTWARTIPLVLRREHPYLSAHLSTGPDDCDVTPHRLHPAFHGCLDWHSSCHMQWSAVRLLTTAGESVSTEGRRALTEVLDERLTVENVAAEVAYLRTRPSFERPYGWGWAAMLAAGCRQAAHAEVPGAEAWATATAPLLDVVLDLVAAWLPRLGYPVRSGEHPNVAFALGLVLDAVDAVRPEHPVRALVETRAREWFEADRDYPAAWEPGGSDFLSPALAEADLMRRVLPAAELRPWLAAFLPGLDDPTHPLRGVPVVSDPSDGKGAHLLGLALHRAAALRSLAIALPAPVRAEIRRRTGGHVESVADAVVAGDFMATHWLVSFALLAVEAGEA